MKTVVMPRQCYPTIEGPAVSVTDRDVVASPPCGSSLTTHSELLEGEREAAAVVDLPDQDGLGGWEGGEVAGGALVQSGDAAGDIYLPPVLRVFHKFCG